MSNRTCVLTNTQLLLHVTEGGSEVEEVWRTTKELGTRKNEKVIKSSQHGFTKRSSLTSLTIFYWLGRQGKSRGRCLPWLQEAF